MTLTRTIVIAISTTPSWSPPPSPSPSTKLPGSPSPPLSPSTTQSWSPSPVVIRHHHHHQQHFRIAITTTWVSWSPWGWPPQKAARDPCRWAPGRFWIENTVWPLLIGTNPKSFYFLNETPLKSIYYIWDPPKSCKRLLESEISKLDLMGVSVVILQLSFIHKHFTI